MLRKTNSRKLPTANRPPALTHSPRHRPPAPGSPQAVPRPGVVLISPFVEKTFDMVSDAKNKEYVKWSDSGDTLIINDINTFSDLILPEYFNHNNYSSFIRQLNMYGFRKENKEKKTKQEEYKHEYFRKGSKELLKNITRKKKPDEEADGGRGTYHSSSKHASHHHLLIPLGQAKNGGRERAFEFRVDDLATIKPEVLEDHVATMKRVRLLLDSYNGLVQEKHQIMDTLSKVSDAIIHIKEDVETKLNTLISIMFSLVPENRGKPTQAGRGAPTKGGNFPANLAIPMVEAGQNKTATDLIKLFSLIKNFDGNPLISQLPKGYYANPVEHMEPKPMQIDWEQSSVNGNNGAEIQSTKPEISLSEHQSPRALRREALSARRSSNQEEATLGKRQPQQPMDNSDILNIRGMYNANPKMIKFEEPNGFTDSPKPDDRMDSEKPQDIDLEVLASPKIEPEEGLLGLEGFIDPKKEDEIESYRPDDD